ncbi:MAG: riboflavin synthase [Synergistaceae bacterium]|nr:riboflavin synthase [Synergistaceae bacterium]
MFTGLIESIGVVRKFHQTGEFYSLTIESNFSGELQIGQSVSVSGACLTVTRNDSRSFDVEMMNETFRRTWFCKNLRTGTRVNLERAMRLTDRLDGHLVLGHVDGVAVLREIRGTDTKEAVFVPDDRDLLRGIVNKGSVCIDGVSLTVINATDKNFSVGLIPATLAATSLGDLKAGVLVNLETDILGKYVARLAGFGFSSESNSQRGDYLTSLLSL